MVARDERLKIIFFARLHLLVTLGVDIPISKLKILRILSSYLLARGVCATAGSCFRVYVHKNAATKRRSAEDIYTFAHCLLSSHMMCDHWPGRGSCGKSISLRL
jgi:hypothetical protein